MVMEEVILWFDILNLTRYQLQIMLPSSQSAVAPKLIRMWTKEISLMDQNQLIYKIWDHS
jgi:hypothetical protein